MWRCGAAAGRVACTPHVCSPSSHNGLEHHCEASLLFPLSPHPPQGTPDPGPCAGHRWLRPGFRHRRRLGRRVPCAPQPWHGRHGAGHRTGGASVGTHCATSWDQARGSFAARRCHCCSSPPEVHVVAQMCELQAWGPKPAGSPAWSPLHVHPASHHPPPPHRRSTPGQVSALLARPNKLSRWRRSWDFWHWCAPPHDCMDTCSNEHSQHRKSSGALSAASWRGAQPADLVPPSS